MPNFTPIRTIAAKLNSIPVVDGQLILVVDKGEIYCDINFGDETIRALIGTTIDEDTTISGGTAPIEEEQPTE